MPVPKVIHFIWAGGDKPFPDNATLQAWRERNPDFEIILWVDKTTTHPEVIENYTNSEGFYQYQDIGSQNNLMELLGRQMQEEVSQEPKPIKIMDIREVGLCKVGDPVDYEIRRFESNYGSSSDILRYRILTEFGGAYFDADIDPGQNPLSHYVDVFDSSDPVFKFSMFAQGQEDAPGNDAFICSPKHPLMQAIWERSINNYTRGAATPIDPDTYEGSEGFDHTLERTGPTCVSNVLTDQGMINESEEGVEVNPQVVLDRQFFSPRPQNTRNWVNIPIKKSENIEHALHIANESMQFEAEIIGIVRFAKHARDMLRSLRVDFDAHLQASCRPKIFEIISNLSPEDYNHAGSVLLQKLLDDKLTSEQVDFFKTCNDVNARAQFIASELTRPAINKLKDYYGFEEGVKEYLSDHLGVPWTEIAVLSQDIENNIGWENEEAIITLVEQFVQPYIENIIKLDAIKHWIAVALAAPEDKIRHFGFDRGVQRAIGENNLEIIAEKIAQYFIRPETPGIEALLNTEDMERLAFHASDFIVRCGEDPPRNFKALMQAISTSQDFNPSPMERKLGQILYDTMQALLSKEELVVASEDKSFIKELTTKSSTFGMREIIQALGGPSTSAPSQVVASSSAMEMPRSEPDVRNARGDNELHTLIREHIEADRLLQMLQEGSVDPANINCTNDEGFTALELASQLYAEDEQYIEDLRGTVNTVLLSIYRK